MCAVMKMGEVKVFTKCHLPQKSELLHYFRVKDGGESVSQAWDIKSSLPYKSNWRLPCGSRSLLLFLLILWHADSSHPYFSGFPFGNDNIKCTVLNNPKGRDSSWWASGHSVPTHTLLKLEGNVFFWNGFTPWRVDHIFWHVALLTFLECLWPIRPLVMGQSTKLLSFCVSWEASFLPGALWLPCEHFPWTQYFLAYGKGLEFKLDLELYKGGFLSRISHKALIIAINSKRTIWRGFREVL